MTTGKVLRVGSDLYSPPNKFVGWWNQTKAQQPAPNCQHCAFNASSTLLAASYGDSLYAVCVWNVKSGQRVRVFNSEGWPVANTPYLDMVDYKKSILWLCSLLPGMTTC